MSLGIMAVRSASVVMLKERMMQPARIAEPADGPQVVGGAFAPGSGPGTIERGEATVLGLEATCDEP